MSVVDRTLRALELFTRPRIVLALVQSRARSIASVQSLSELQRIVPEVGTFVDVGANVGQFALAAAHFYPRAVIHSFEPVPRVAARLRHVTRGRTNIRVHELAVGAQSGTVSFYENEYSQVSSALEISPSSMHPSYDSGKHRSILVPMSTLDEFGAQNPIIGPVLLKLDAQGLEHEVLRGARAFMSSVDYVLIEVPFMQLYKDQPTFEQLHDLLSQHGFSILRPLGFHRSSSVGISEADMLYHRPRGS